MRNTNAVPYYFPERAYCDGYIASPKTIRRLEMNLSDFAPPAGSLQHCLSKSIARSIGRRWLKDEASGDFLLPLNTESISGLTDMAERKINAGSLDCIYVIDRLDDEGQFHRLDGQTANRLWDCTFVEDGPLLRELEDNLAGAIRSARRPLVSWLGLILDLDEPAQYEIMKDPLLYHAVVPGCVFGDTRTEVVVATVGSLLQFWRQKLANMPCEFCGEALSIFMAYSDHDVSYCEAYCHNHSEQWTFTWKMHLHNWHGSYMASLLKQVPITGRPYSLGTALIKAQARSHPRTSR